MTKTEYRKFFNIDLIVKDIQKYLPDFNKKRFLDAFLFALEAHKGQFRKDGVTPYIQHPVKTVEILAKLQADEETLISGLLHDVPEDTAHDVSEIKGLFGDKVAFLVDGITKLSKVHYQHNMPERQIESLRKLLLHSAEDLRVVVIKLADRLHNMETLDNIDSQEKKMRIATETLEIYVPIANLLGIRAVKGRMEDLCFKHLFPSEYEQIKSTIHKNEKKREQNFARFSEKIRKASKKENIKIRLEKKEKNFYSIYKKICALGNSLDSIDDRIGMKIITENLSDCYRVLGIIHSRFLPKPDRFKDHIANPKKNGYQSLHTSVFGVDGVLTEIQIRTKVMDLEANYGVAASSMKNNNHLLENVEWLQEVLRIESSKDDSKDFMEGLRSDVLEERIFVFTPKGDSIDLPKKATVLDLAYKIHSELGDHAYKAEVNGKLRSINYRLKTGDTVKVISSDNVSPRLSWLSFVKTNLAKNKILDYLKRISRERKIKEGKEMLQKEFDVAGLGLCEAVNFKKLSKGIDDKFNISFKDIAELFAAIGEGVFRTSDAISVIVDDQKNYFSKFRKSETNDKRLRLEIKILADDRFGLLREIYDILYKYSLDIIQLQGESTKNKEAYFSADVVVRDLKVITMISHELEEVEGIKKIYRIPKNRLVMFYTASLATIVLWIAHPFAVASFTDQQFRLERPIFTDFLVNGVMLLLIFAAIYLSSILKNYFPLARERKVVKFFPFVIPVVGLLSILLELAYLNLELSWELVLPELLLLYSYLILNLNNDRIAKKRT